jgi:hypothetical protein
MVKAPCTAPSPRRRWTPARRDHAPPFEVAPAFCPTAQPSSGRPWSLRPGHGGYSCAMQGVALTDDSGRRQSVVSENCDGRGGPSARVSVATTGPLSR